MCQEVPHAFTPSQSQTHNKLTNFYPNIYVIAKNEVCHVNITKET